MINVRIGQNTFEAASHWKEITLSQGVELHHICKTAMPKELMHKYDLIINSKDLDRDIEDWSNELDASEIIKTFPKFYGKIIQFFTGCDNDTIDYTTIESRTNIFTLYFEKFVIGILFNGIGYNPLGITSFIHQKNEYFLPSDKRIGDLLVPCNDLTTVQFCESADLISYINKQERGFKYSAYVCAILCLKKDEKYNEDTITNRAVREFNTLPMDIVWEVFFCLTNFQITSMEDSHHSFHQRVINVIPTENSYNSAGVDSSLTYTLSQIMPFSWN